MKKISGYQKLKSENRILRENNKEYIAISNMLGICLDNEIDRRKNVEKCNEKLICEKRELKSENEDLRKVNMRSNSEIDKKSKENKQLKTTINDIELQLCTNRKLLAKLKNKESDHASEMQKLEKIISVQEENHKRRKKELIDEITVLDREKHELQEKVVKLSKKEFDNDVWRTIIIMGIIAATIMLMFCL